MSDLDEIDQALAEKLMGWHLVIGGYVPSSWNDRDEHFTGWLESGIDAWQPTRSWAHAGMVVEAMIARKYEPCDIYYNAWTQQWHAAFSREFIYHDEAPTFPEAISRAAVAALEE